MSRYVAVLSIALACSAAEAPKTDSQPKVKGTVVDADGAPIKGAVIEIYTYTSGGRRFFSGDVALAEKIAAPEGAFEFSRPAPGCVVVARKDGLAPDWRQYYGGVNDESEVKLVLGAPGTIRGTVAERAGKPVPDAEVFVTAAATTVLQEDVQSISVLTGIPARDLFNTRTGPDGKFEIKGLPTNSTALIGVRVAGLVLADSGDGLRAFQGKLPYGPGQDDIRLELEPSGVIEGMIAAESPGQKAPEAEIILESRNNPYFSVLAGLLHANSGPDGKFRLADIPAGTYSLRAKFGTNDTPDWVAESVSVTVDAGRTNVLETPIAASGGGLVEVSVVDKKTRKGVGGATVSAYRQEESVGVVVSESGATSDKDGKALLRMVPGSYNFSANYKTRYGGNVSASVEAGKTNAVELELASPQVIKGVVRGSDGKPAAGIEVRTVNTFGGGRNKPLKTDDEGRFETDVTRYPQSRTESEICVIARDLQRNLAVSETVGEDTESVELKLVPCITITGQVESDGKPIQKPNVALVFWTGNSGMHLTGWSTNGDKPGAFVIPALPLGHKYSVIISAKGYGQKQANVVAEPATESAKLDAGNFDLPRATLKLSGKVVDQDEKPVKGASVNMSGDGQPSGSATTDKDGRFSFDAVCEGSVRLWAYAMNANGNVNAEGGDTNVVLQLGSPSVRYSSGESGGKLQGVATDPDGKPVKGAKAMVFPSEYGQAGVSTRDDGSFTLRWSAQPWQIESGDLLLVVRDVSRNLAAAQNFDTKATNIAAKLQPAWIVTGKVQDSSGKPLAKAQVALLVSAGRMTANLEAKATETDSEGKFEFKAVPPGPSYHISATLKEYGRVQRELSSEAESGKVEVEPVVLNRADKIVSGQVLTSNDKPASGAYVQIIGDGQPQGNVQTDKNGRFKLAVCDGEVRVYANGDNSYGDVTVTAGDTNVVINLHGYDQPRRSAPSRASLKGKPLPDLGTVGLAADAAPSNQPLLLCLLDAEQRPSRRVARVLAEKNDTLKQKGVCILLVQAVAASDETIKEWTNSVSMPFALGRVTEKSTENKWATEVQSLPWFILRDREGKVVDEGFPVEELDAKLQDLLTPAIDLGVPTTGTKK